MNAKDHIFARLKTNLLDDKMGNVESLSRLMKSEIVRAIDAFVEIDMAESSIEFVCDACGMTINAKIRAKGIKRIGQIVH
ncbi:MAG: hypothetical protein IJW24_00020 [Clostridia bacterium]|nr:hypothetical protein [Clostridia bacterium]